MTMQSLYLINGTDPAKLAAVKAEMAIMGSPTVRVVDCGDHYMAIEGCHRLMAAAELGIAPRLTVLAQDDMVAADSLDIDGFAAGETYTAGEVAGELRGTYNPVLKINYDGTLTGG